MPYELYLLYLGLKYCYGLEIKIFAMDNEIFEAGG